MKVGDLVTFGPGPMQPLIVTDLEAHDLHMKTYLPDCVMCAIPERQLDHNIVWTIAPVTKRLLKIISEC